MAPRRAEKVMTTKLKPTKPKQRDLINRLEAKTIGKETGRDKIAQEQLSMREGEIQTHSRGVSMFSLLKNTPEHCSVQTKFKINCYSPMITWNIFLAQLQNTSKWNHLNRISNEEVIQFTNRVIPNLRDLDRHGFIGDFRPNHEELSYKTTWSRILIHQRHTANWNQVNSYFCLGDINFPNQKIPDMLHLDTYGFLGLESYVWRPGEFLIQLNTPQDISSFNLSNWIKKNQCPNSLILICEAKARQHPEIMLKVMDTPMKLWNHQAAMIPNGHMA